MRLFIVVSLVLVTQGVLLAEGESVSKSSPWKTIQATIEAIRSGDFEGYVNLLTDNEVDVQAGYIYYVSTISGLSPAANDMKPSELLTIRLIEEVKQKHLLPREQWTKKHREIEQFPSRLLGMAFFQGLAQAGVPASVAASNGGANFGMQGTMRDQCRQIATLIKDRRKFVVELMTEWCHPLEVTKNGKTEVEQRFPVELEPLLSAYEKANWTIYRRGRFAIAVGKTVSDEETSAKDSAPNERGNEFKIELRLVGDSWKIQSLLPDMSTTQTTAAVEPQSFDPYASQRNAKAPSNYSPAPVASPTPYPIYQTR